MGEGKTEAAWIPAEKWRDKATTALHLPYDFRALIERCYGTGEWEQNAVAWDKIRKADLIGSRKANSFTSKVDNSPCAIP